MKATFIEDGKSLSTSFKGEKRIKTSFGEVQRVGEPNLLVATTEEWNSQRDLIAKKNVVYVYSDYVTDHSGRPVPSFKVGDGLAYLIDLPFNDDMMFLHMNDTDIHISEEDRAFWNNKVTAFINAMDPEDLVLTKN